MEALCSSEALVTTPQTTQCHNPEEHKGKGKSGSALKVEAVCSSETDITYHYTMRTQKTFIVI